MILTSYVYLFLFFYFLPCSVLSTIDVITSDFGNEKCNSDKVKVLKDEFYDINCGGKSIFPSIEWIDKTPSVKSYALSIVSDNESHAKVHFISWNIPANLTKIEGSTDFLGMGASIGINSFNEKKYEGICPTSQHNETECVQITLYALNQESLDLSEDADYFEFITTLRGLSKKGKILLESLSLYAIAPSIIQNDES